MSINKIINKCVFVSGLMMLGMGSTLAAPEDRGCYLTKIHPFDGDRVIIHLTNEITAWPNDAEVWMCGHEVDDYDVDGYNVSLHHSHIIVNLDERSSRDGEACLIEVKLFYAGFFAAPQPSFCSAWTYGEEFVVDDLAPTGQGRLDDSVGEGLGNPW